MVAAGLLWILVPDNADGGAKSGDGDRGAIAPAASVQPSAAPNAPGPKPVPGAVGEQPAGNGSTLGPNGGGPLASGNPAPTGGAPNPGPATETTRPDTTATTDPTGEPPATQPPSGGRTLSSAGGAVVAECAGGKAELTSWDPAEDYKVDKVNAGPALAPVIIFKNQASRVRMTVTCVAGIPTAVVLPL